jgi:hypothetical protein
MTRCADSTSQGAVVPQVVGGVSDPLPTTHVEHTRHQRRFHRQIADEIAQIADHGGRGSRQALWAHLKVRFGQVEADDLLHGLDLLPTTISERFP